MKRIPLPLQALIAVGLSSALIVVTSGGCTTAPATDTTPPAVPSASSGAESQNQPSPSSTSAPLVQSRCEDFGSLNGKALKAFRSAGSESILVPLPKRPVPSRLGVIAVGKKADLVGQSVALGVAENSNYATCTHCLAVAIDCGTDCKAATWFFPRSGTGRFTDVGVSFEGTFTDVVLEQVSIDWKTMHSTPVAGGACIRISDMTFAATTVVSPIPVPVPGDAGAGASDAGDLPDGGTIDDPGGSSGASGSSSSGTSGSSGSETSRDQPRLKDLGGDFSE